MSETSSGLLRVEFTVLNEKLFSPSVKFISKPRPILLYSTRYSDAVSKPFPYEGKAGLSIFVGKLEQFEQEQIALLWDLEKQRGRSRIAVVTNLAGKAFMPAVRKLEKTLSDPTICPLSYLRRRQNVWNSLDFFHSAENSPWDNNHPRLRRLQQRAWENMVDKIALEFPEIREIYFEELDLKPKLLKETLYGHYQSKSLSAMVGIAGQCLQKQHFASLLGESHFSALIERLSTSPSPPPPKWVFLSKRSDADELLLCSQGAPSLETGTVLTANNTDTDSPPLKLEIKERLQECRSSVDGMDFCATRVKVDWGNPPEDVIPINWMQKSDSPAGSLRGFG